MLLWSIEPKFDLNRFLPTIESKNLVAIMIVSNSVPVGHANDEDVVELVDTVDLGEELVDHGVVDAGAARHGAPRL